MPRSKEIVPELRALGERLRSVRKANGMSLDDVAAAWTERPQAKSHLSDIERGRQNVTVRTLMRLAAIYKAPLFALFLLPGAGPVEDVATQLPTLGVEEREQVAGEIADVIARVKRSRGARGK